jgi:uncharacterized protein YbjQ (UPF0145 family)
MLKSKDILVVTTSTLEGVKVLKYLKPISAHVVGGTKIFNDFLGELRDVFGGHSKTYQIQMSSLYSESIESLKKAAYESGANAILGLKVDLNEISGKNKTMFMITAVGTAVVIEDLSVLNSTKASGEIIENVSLDSINSLKWKLSIIEQANNKSLSLDEDVWSFITVNHIIEVYPFLLEKFESRLQYHDIAPDASIQFYDNLKVYFDAQDDSLKSIVLYSIISDSNNEKLVKFVSRMINELNLFNYHLCMDLLKSEDFIVQKRGVLVSSFNKSIYSLQDKIDLESLKNFLENNFPERGTRSSKKQLLSSREKDVWICECTTVNDIGQYCVGCKQDINGFKENEVKPSQAISIIQQDIELINKSL